jgi:hypothetical protein
MERQYSRADIEMFVAHNLKIVGIDTKAEQDAIRASFANTIEKLPPWQQIIMIESRRTNVTGVSQEINAAYHDNSNNKLSRVLGFFMPGDMTLKFNKAADVSALDPILWEVGREQTFHHEEGHRQDKYLGAFLKTGFQYYSDADEDWKEALNLEMADRSATEKPSSKRGFKALFSWSSNESSKERPLYANYTKLEKHLALYGPESHRIESFAEMTAHYSMVYAGNDGNEKKVDKILSEYYPHLWPVYRETAIPNLKKLAEGLVNVRDKAITIYAENARKFFEVLQTPRDDHAIEEKARELSLQGTLYNDMEALKKRTLVYQNPVPYYLRALENIQDKRNDMAGVPQPFDYAREEPIAQKRCLNEGKLSLGRESFELERELSVLHRFDHAYDRFLNAINFTQDERRDPSSIFSYGSVLKAYDRLKDERGLSVVEASLDLIPRSREVESYTVQRENQYLLRQRMLNGEGETIKIPYQLKETIAVDILDKVNKSQSASLEEEIESLKYQNKLLERYNNAIEGLADKINQTTGSSIPAPRSATILKSFDDIVQLGGLSAVAVQIERLNVKVQKILDYTIACENKTAIANQIARDGGDISYGAKSGVYAPLSIEEEDLPEDFRNKMGTDIFRMIFKNSYIDMDREAARMKIDVHEMIGQAVGRPRPVPPNILDNARGIPDVEPERRLTRPISFDL